MKLPPPLPLLFPSLSLSPQKHGPRTHFHSSFFFYYSQPSMYRPSTSTNSPLLLPKVIFSSNPSNMFCCSLTLSPLPQATPHLQSIPLTALPFPLFSSSPVVNGVFRSTRYSYPPPLHSDLEMSPATPNTFPFLPGHLAPTIVATGACCHDTCYLYCLQRDLWCQFGWVTSQHISVLCIPALQLSSSVCLYLMM